MSADFVNWTSRVAISARVADCERQSRGWDDWLPGLLSLAVWSGRGPGRGGQVGSGSRELPPPKCTALWTERGGFRFGQRNCSSEFESSRRPRSLKANND